MTIKRKFKAKMMLALRSIGLLCKKPSQPTRRIRIAKTCNPNGTITEHGKLTEQPLYDGNTFETELHIWKEIHKNNQTLNKK
jgi:hypothetical protein